MVEYRTSDSFKFQIYLLSSMACLRFGFLKELVWLWYESDLKNRTGSSNSLFEMSRF